MTEELRLQRRRMQIAYARWGRVFTCVILSFLAKPASGQSVDDYLTHGYDVLSETSVVGVFFGCKPGLTLTFEDGSRFACLQTEAQTSYNARVYILGLTGQAASAVLIGSRAYSGVLNSLGAHILPHPARINAGAVLTGLPPALDDARIGRLSSVQSINVIQQDAAKRLNDTQADPLPPRAPIPHK